MLTVFGLKGGADVFWCGFRIRGFNTNGVSATKAGFIGPLPFRLPPNNGKAYYISKDGFGLAGDEIPLGYLESERFPYGVPKPCQHLNAIGTVVAKPENGYATFGYGNFSTDFNNTPTYLSPSTSGPKVKQFFGLPTPRGRSYYWKRDGSSVRNSDSSRVTEFYDLMYNGYPIGNKPPDGTIAYRYGQRVYYPVAPYTFSQRYVEYMFAPSLINLNTFLFKGDYVDHVGSSNQGTYYKLEGTFTMSKIVGNTDGTFMVYGTYDVITKRWYIDARGVRGDLPDIVDKTATWRYLHIIDSSAVVGSSGKIMDGLDKELYEYEGLAKSLYDEKLMKVARSNAIADITALQSNNLENISGLKGSISIIGTLFEGYKAVINGDVRAGVKALSSAYLWYSYALAPTISDSKDIAKNTDKIIDAIAKNPFSNERRRGRASVTGIPRVGRIDYNVTYHTRLKDNYYSQLYTALQRVGLHPAVSQGWDFIPFSFVVDWFLGIGPILTKLDDYNAFVMHRDIKSRIESFKATKTEELRASVDPSMYEFVGPYIKSYYQRLIHSGPGDIDPFSGQSSAGNRSSQMLQGTSLITQQLD